MKRREFIKKSGLAATGSFLIPGFVKAFEKHIHSSAEKENDKILIVIQLSGGNDGLNTVVPFRNDIYYKLRPSISIQQNELITLNDATGLHPSLYKLKELYDQGYVSIINNVGYPNPNRSHFRSLDIWHSGAGADQYINTGWVGRYLDASCSDCEKPYKAIELNDSLSLALKGEKTKGLSLSNPERLYEMCHNDFFTKLEKNHREDHDNISYLYKTLSETISSSAYIYEKTKIQKLNSEYPAKEFGKDLKQIAEMIISGLDTSVYYASLSGFDTHAGQKTSQERLLNLYSEGIYALVNDLKKHNRFKDVIILTFSEFGRRVKQNASNGTDHGAANNLFILSENLNKKGIYNNLPDLSDLDQGDLVYSIDFREIYATLLDKWLNIDHQSILNKKFPNMNFI